ncbi:NUDIX hydrolase [Fundidesulfovibrio butyratiphilus]
MSESLHCERCGHSLKAYRNPTPTVDIVIHAPGRGVVLVSRVNPPLGWALPGGFVDEGETVEQCAIREAREETGLDVELTGLLGVYSDPARDPRMHTLSVVFTAQAVDPSRLKAGDDAAQAAFYPLDALPHPLCFDHAKILDDFIREHTRLNRFPRRDKDKPQDPT